MTRTTGKQTGDSAVHGYNSRRDPLALGLGRTVRLDRPHVDGPGKRGAKEDDGSRLIDKVYRRTEPVCRESATWSANRGAAGVDHHDGRDVRGPTPGENSGGLSTNCGTARIVRRPIRRVWIPKPGSNETTAAGNTDGAGPRGASGAACTCWNRSSSAILPNTATASAPDGDAKMRCERVDDLLKAGLRLRGGCRPEKLLRHDPARPAAGAGTARRWRTAACWRWSRCS